jgi:pectate lyase
MKTRIVSGAKFQTSLNPPGSQPALALSLLTAAIATLPAFGQDTLTAGSGFTQTKGGQGGRLIRVTSLEAHGTGSLAEALAAKGPRIIVLEVAGVIDLAGHSLRINEPFVTVAGQTAPSPGITLIRGGIGITTHDVVLQHIRVRPGEAGHEKKSGWEVDGISTAGGAHDVIVDHCSCTWATDENLSASGPRFEGESVEAWRERTSHNVTFSNCLIAEGLSRSTHAKGEHSKGSLIHDNTSNIAIIANLYASDVERCPLFKGGARGVIVNNLIVNPGRKAIHFGLVPDEWGTHPWVAGQMAVVGNQMQAGSDTVPGLPLVSHSRGPLELYLQGNLALDRSGKPLPEYSTLSGSDPKAACTLVKSPPLWPVGLKALPVERVRDAVLANAGARPWDRDAIDRRIIEEAKNNTGHIIDSEQQVGGYPNPMPVHSAFNPQEWDLATMDRRRAEKP